MVGPKKGMYKKKRSQVDENGNDAVSVFLMSGLRFLVGVGVVFAAGSHDQEKIEMAKKAKVSVEEASAIALKERPGTIIEAEIEDEHGSLMLDIEVVTADGTIREVHIDALAGKVVGHYFLGCGRERSGLMACVL